MKQRFSYLDLQIILNELRPLEKYRLQNIYDLATSSRQFLLKFAIPDSKKLVIVDPGFRIHLTEYERPTAQSPSGFVAKLRKHLKARRLNALRLAPQNRVLVLSFSDDHSYHLVFEFFSGGNMILLDKECRILALQRVVSATETQARCAVGETYPLDKYLTAEENAEDITEISVRKWLTDDEKVEPEEGDEAATATVNPLQRNSDRRITKTAAKKPNLKKRLYFKVPGIATGLIEEALKEQNVDPNMKLDQVLQELGDSVQPIVDALKAAHHKSQALTSSSPVPGYILAKSNPRFDPSKAKSDSDELDVSGIDPHNIRYLYEEFQPYRPEIPKTDGGWKVFELASYNKAIDVYFSTLDATKLSMRVANRELVAEKRLNAAKQEKENRVKGLNDVQERSNMLGNILLANAELVEEACEAVRRLVAQGMDWTDIAQLIQIEKDRDNPVAEIVALPLNLEKNKISVLLPELRQDNESESDRDTDSSDSDSEDEKDTPAVKRVKIEVDLALTAYANAGTYFEVKKSAAAKQERTLQTADKAFKNAEKKIQRDLKQAIEKEQNQQKMYAVREPLWFEKFFWFMSSDGYLVLAGRDTMQNELLFRRHFKQHDIIVGCEADGASIAIIKNHMQVPEMPPSTLLQAGTFVASTSTKAWESKMSPATWWARFDQVPKLSQQGEIITTDRLVVKGEGKHHQPPGQQDMGFGFMWLIDDESKKNYSRPAVPSVRASPEPEAAEVDDSDSDEEFPDTQISDDEEEAAPVVEEQKEEQVEEEPKEVGVDEPSKPEEPSKDISKSNKTIIGVKRMSAKERRQLRKERAADAADSNEATENENEPVNEIERELAGLRMKKGRNFDSDTDSVVSQSTQKQQVRGKKGKLKRAAKYADQDDEDRQRAMEVLGATKGAERARVAEEAKRQKEEQEKQRKLRIQKQKERELQKLVDAEANNDVEEAPGYAFENVVPRLVAGDTPRGAIPVFGPWGAMQKVKLRVKIQPGQVKKGKATKDIIRGLSMAKTDPNGRDVDIPWPIEVEQVQAIKDTDLLLPITVSKVQFTLPGSSKSKQNGGGAKSKGKPGKRK